MRGGQNYKSPAQYEAEARRVSAPYPHLKKPCLIHPSKDNPARKCYVRRHGSTPLLVCHHCDRRQCVEDTHHFLGTYADNLADARSKGRLLRTDESKAKTRAANTFPPEVRARISAACREAWARRRHA